MIQRTCVLLAITGSLAACGGRLSHKDYVKKGDAICRQTNAQSAAVKVPATNDAQGTADYLRSSSSLLITQADRLAALKPPKKDAPRLADVFNRDRAALEQLRLAATQFQSGESVTAQATASNARDELDDVKQDLQGYGFQDCANQ